jgi:serine phosphatase RsbU (regulator of sigma subunit)/TolA-binding protein
METSSDDLKKRAQDLHLEARRLCDTDSELSIKNAEECLQMARKYGFREEEILAKENLAYHLWHGGNIAKALELLNDCRVIRNEMMYFSYYDWCAKSIALIHWGRGNYDEAFQTVYDALTTLDGYQNEKDKCLCYWSLGVFFYDLKDYERSQEYYQKSVELSNEDSLLDNNITAYNLIGIGCCLKETGNTEHARGYFEKALEKSDQYDQWMQRARCLFELGSLHSEKKEFNQAKSFLEDSLQIRREHASLPGMISCLMGLGDIELESKNHDLAIAHLSEALEISETLGSKTKRFQCFEKLAQLYRFTGDHEKAFDFLQKHHEVRADVVGERSNNRIKELERKFSSIQAEKEAEIQRLINVELKDANELISARNDEILSSVNYARMIQRAILPSENSLSEHLTDFFLIYLPKDIVAGDFYWLEIHQNKILFAVADCTGHGVPGGMLSVLCSTALTRAVKEYDLFSPAQILDKTRQLVVDAFSKSEENLNDGMDIALFCLDVATNTLLFSGAQRQLIRIRNGELEEFTGNKQPIGRTDIFGPFDEHKISLRMGDQIYLTTDGFADQFGGERDKKFKSSALRDLLLEISTLELSVQKEILEAKHREWKGSNEQTDDICIVGLKIT